MFKQLCTVLSEKSQSDAPKCFDEWEPTSMTRVPYGDCRTCVCGKKGLKKYFTITNTENGNTIAPIGSQCIYHFAGGHELQPNVNQLRREELHEKIKLASCINDCKYPDCEEKCEHDFCKTHKKMCENQAQKLVKFGKHKGKTWSDVVNYEPRYATWVTENLTDYNHPTFGPHIKSRNAYLLAKLAKGI